MRLAEEEAGTEVKRSGKDWAARYAHVLKGDLRNGDGPQIMKAYGAMRWLFETHAGEGGGR